MRTLKSIFFIFAAVSVLAITSSAYFTARGSIDNNEIVAGTWQTPTPSPSVSANVRICHATGDHYQDISPSAEGVINGHVGPSHQDGRDIIPPFYYGEPIQYFPGQNWDAEGQAIWNNNCEISAGPLGVSLSPSPSPSVSPSKSPSPTPSESPSPTETPTETPSPDLTAE